MANDVSVRDWQRASGQHTVGKSFDTHAPLGPWITTADEIGDPHALGIRCLVNGEERQVSNTRELVFNCFQRVQQLSSAKTLEPGDVFLLGTPGGVDRYEAAQVSEGRGCGARGDRGPWRDREPRAQGGLTDDA